MVFNFPPIACFQLLRELNALVSSDGYLFSMLVISSKSETKASEDSIYEYIFKTFGNNVFLKFY